MAAHRPCDAPFSTEGCAQSLCVGKRRELSSEASTLDMFAGAEARSPFPEGPFVAGSGGVSWFFSWFVSSWGTKTDVSWLPSLMSTPPGACRRGSHAPCRRGASHGARISSRLTSRSGPWLGLRCGRGPMPKGSSTVILGPCKGANPRLDTRGLPEAQDLRFAASSRALAGGLLRSANSGSRSTRRVQGHLGLRRWLQHVATDSLSSCLGPLKHHLPPIPSRKLVGLVVSGFRGSRLDRLNATSCWTASTSSGRMEAGL